MDWSRADCLLLLSSLACGVFGCDPKADESTFSPVRFERNLAAPSPQTNALFGEEVALSGSHVAVTSPFEFADPALAAAYVGDVPSSAEGVVYLFDTANPDDPPLRLVPSGAAPGDGQVAIRELFLAESSESPWPVESVALNADFLAIGQPGQDGGPAASDDPANAVADASVSNAGAVYVYDRRQLERGVLEPIQFLKAPDARAGDMFGYEVAFSNNWLAITAPGEDSALASTPDANAEAPDSGAVYLYRRKDRRFVYDSYIKAPRPRTKALFGSAVAIVEDGRLGDLLVVGASGGSLPSTEVNRMLSKFVTDTVPGVAYAYRYDAAGWLYKDTLAPAMEQELSAFGAAVRASPDYVVVGAPGAKRCPDEMGSPPSARGTSYLFTRDGDSWRRDRCFHPRGSHSDLFGDSVALNENRILIGAGFDFGGSPMDPGDAGVEFSGAAYLAERSGKDWAEPVYIKAPRVTKDEVFGYGLDMDAKRFVIGAPKHTRARGKAPAAESAGLVYVFDLVADP